MLKRTQNKPDKICKGGSHLTSLKSREPIHKLQARLIEQENQNKHLKKELAELEASQKKFFRLFDEAPAAYFTLDVKGQIIDLNQAAADLLGTPKETLLHTCFDRFVVPDARQRFKIYIHEAFQQAIQRTCEVELFIENSISIAVKLTSRICLDTNLSFPQLNMIITDVSRLKFENAKHYKNARFFQGILDSIQDDIMIVDSDGNIILTNYWLELKYSQHMPLRGKKFNQVFCRQNKPDSDCPIIETISNGDVHSKIISQTDKEGKDTWSQLTAFPLTGSNRQLVGTVVYSKDITELKKAEMLLKESEARYRQILDHAPAGILEIDYSTGSLTSVNDVMCKLSGYSREELLAIPAINLLAPESRPIFKDRLHRIAKDLPVKEIVEYKIKKKDGSFIWVLLNARFLKKDDKISGATVVIHDITRRKKAEELARYKELFDNVAEKVVIFNRSGKIIEFNNIALEQSGYLREELLNHSYKDFICKDQIILVDHALTKIHQSRQARFEVELQLKNETTILHAISARLVSYQGRICLLCVARDISDAKLMQDTLIRSERLAATGQLAASIAHEINSPLQGIAALLNVIKNSHSSDTELNKNISLIKDAFSSIRNTVKNLLDLNRPGRELKQPTDINSVISGTVQLVRSHLKNSKVLVKQNLSKDLPKIIISPQKLGQVFLNLINNSVEAITGISSKNFNKLKQQNFFGGEITITTSREKHNIVIRFSDNGPGIPAEDMEHIFDPFYTRKKAMGMGIGLSICYGIIEEHNGTITAQNGAQGGAVFNITLPLEKKEERSTL